MVLPFIMFGWLQPEDSRHLDASWITSHLCKKNRQQALFRPSAAYCPHFADFQLLDAAINSCSCCGKWIAAGPWKCILKPCRSSHQQPLQNRWYNFPYRRSVMNLIRNRTGPKTGVRSDSASSFGRVQPVLVVGDSADSSKVDDTPDLFFLLK
jgi:hypothetical protein